LVASESFGMILCFWGSIDIHHLSRAEISDCVHYGGSYTQLETQGCTYPRLKKSWSLWISGRDGVQTGWWIGLQTQTQCRTLPQLPQLVSPKILLLHLQFPLHLLQSTRRRTPAVYTRYPHCQIISTSAQYDPAKIFLASKFSYYSFPTPPIKLKLGLQTGGRLLITTHLDQSNYLANQQ
jgi:hypothetical protein